MIRIPFSSGSEAPQGSASSVQESSVVPEGRKHLEGRMRLLESKLTTHAEDLKTSLVRRVDRIESRVSRALVSLGTDSEEDAENVVEFESEAKDLHHLPATSALSALNELNETLVITRNHMEALDRSVSRMREALDRSE